MFVEVSLYSQLAVKMNGKRWNGRGNSNEWMVSFSKCVKDLEEETFCVFRDHCETTLFTMKFHILNYLCDHLNKFETVRFLDAFAYEHLRLASNKE